MTDSRHPELRIAVFAIIVMALLAGIGSGLSRLPIPMPDPTPTLVAWHGPLMVSAFFGTVISLERAIAIKTPFAYTAPLLNAIGTLILLTSHHVPAAQLFAVAAAIVLTTVSLKVVVDMNADFTQLLALAAACWIGAGVTWWLTHDATRAVLLWFAFLVITITGERLELTRLLGTPRSAKRACYAIVILLVLAAVGEAFTVEPSGRIFSIGLVFLAIWLMRYDIARHNLRQRGITRYIAICLLSGYGWLGVAGGLGLLGAFSVTSPLRDSALHAIGLGFVMSMVFGHALIIFPVITRLKLSYHAVFYFPLALLHGSLLLRIVATSIDAAHFHPIGALGNALTFLVFGIVMVWRVRAARSISAGHARRL